MSDLIMRFTEAHTHTHTHT